MGTALPFVLFLLLVIVTSTSASELAMGLMWEKELRNPVTAVRIADVDGDGKKEIVVAVSEVTLAGGSGWVYVLESDGEIRAEKNIPGPPSDNLLVDDIDKDGDDEIILGIYSYLHVLDCDCNKVFQSRTGYQYRIMDLDIGDLDGDGTKEIAVAAGTRNHNKIYIYDSDGSIKWAKATSGRPYAIDIFDLENDGSLDVIVGTVGGRTDPRLSYPAYIYAFDSKGEKKWGYRTEKGTNSMLVADIDNDGKGEILAGSWPTLSVFDHEGNSEWNYTTGGRINALAVEDLDNDGSMEIIIASNDVYVLDNKGELICKNPVGSEVYALAIEDLDKDGKAEIMVGSDRFYILDSECNEVWNYRTGLSVKSISVDDLDNDGYYEVAIGSADRKLYVFGSKEHVMGSSAEDSCDEAQKLYLAGKLELALNYSRNARELYLELNDNQGVSRAERLMEQIEGAITDKVKEKEAADSYYGMAEDLSIAGDYLNASRYAKIARAKYTSLGELDLLSKADSLLEKTDSMVALMADSIYNNGSQKYSEREYMDAISILEDAREHYFWVKDKSGSRNSAQLIADSYHELARQQLNAGNLEEANAYSQRARSLYICLDNEGATYCDARNIQIKGAEELLSENRSYEGSRYQEELTDIDSIIGNIASGGGGTGMIPGNIIPEEYMDYLLAIIGVSIVITIIAIIFVSKKKGKKPKWPKKKEEKADLEEEEEDEPEEEEEEKKERKADWEKEAKKEKEIKETEEKVEQLIKIGRLEPEEEPKQRQEIAKINKGTRRGEGASLNILSEDE